MAYTDETIEQLVDRLAGGLAGERGILLPLLHAIQHELGYVPDDATPAIAKTLNLSRADVHGVISFYHDYRRTPPGRHVVKICRAEACKARGGDAIEAAAAETFGTPMNSTRDDGQVTLEPIYCLGLCPTGPNALVDGVPMSRIDAAALSRIARKIAA